MPDISSIGHGSVGPIHRTHAERADRSTSVPGRVDDQRDIFDQVELSDHARLMDRLRQLPGVRQEVVEQVREAIARGEYETPEKLVTAIESLVDDLAE